MAALNFLNKEEASNCFNLGNGEGFSVEEVIDAVKKVTGKNVNIIYLKEMVMNQMFWI